MARRQEPDGLVLSSDASESSDNVSDDVNCAWCNKEQGIPQGEDTHGVCRRHYHGVLLEGVTRRYNRTPSYVERFVRGGR